MRNDVPDDQIKWNVCDNNPFGAFGYEPFGESIPIPSASVYKRNHQL
jgi:hypothetical protein